MKAYLIAPFLLCSFAATADDLISCAPNAICLAPLIRLEVAPYLLDHQLSSSPQLREATTKDLALFLASNDLAEVFLKQPLKLDPLPVPTKPGRCEALAQNGLLGLKPSDCSNKFICSAPEFSDEVRSALCYSTFCSLLRGPKKLKECEGAENVYPTRLHLDPLQVTQLRMGTPEISHESGRTKVCATIEAMQVNLDADMEFFPGKSGDFPTPRVSNLKLQLDGQRKVCLSGILKSSSSMALSELKFEYIGEGTFASDQMINAAINGSEISGLEDTYGSDVLNTLKPSLLPALMRGFRPAIEKGIQEGLAAVFETQINKFLAEGQQHAQTLSTPTNSFLSEISIGNMLVEKALKTLEDSIASGKKNDISKALRELDVSMSQYEHVTGESLRKRLLALPPHPDILRLANKIAANQNNSQFYTDLAFMEQLNNQLGGQVTLGVPEMCGEYSSISNRSIKGCEAQAYIDLNEFNQLLRKMYETGRLCHQGRGENCYFMLESKPDGMSCYLDGPPSLRYEAGQGKYRLRFNTRNCSRPAMMLGLGKVGGDINFDIGYQADICEGDFCLKNGEAKWEVEPGTARGAFRDESILKGAAVDAMGKQLGKMLGQTLRLPLTSPNGPFALVPFKAAGKTDQGEGYFGTCLTFK